MVSTYLGIWKCSPSIYGFHAPLHLTIRKGKSKFFLIWASPCPVNLLTGFVPFSPWKESSLSGLTFRIQIPIYVQRTLNRIAFEFYHSNENENSTWLFFIINQSNGVACLSTIPFNDLLHSIDVNRFIPIQLITANSCDRTNRTPRCKAKWDTAIWWSSNEWKVRGLLLMKSGSIWICTSAATLNICPKGVTRVWLSLFHVVYPFLSFRWFLSINIRQKKNVNWTYCSYSIEMISI